VVVCAECGQDNPARARFCLACGTPITPPAPPVEERKVVTALFTDIVGSTASAEELDPEDVRARLAPYYARLRRELESYGGTVEKFIGDAVVALFGAPVAHEDDPERAVRAALAVNRAIAELNAETAWLNLHVRTAVHTGEALVVVGARVSEGEGMAAGDVMNTAARLQSKAPPDGIVVGEATYRATADLFEFREADPVEAKGKAKPVPVWELVGERPAPVRPSTRTPLVGRQAEFAELRETWQEVVATRRTRVVTLLGAPGIGKTRLLVALSEHVEDEADIHWGRCLPYGEGITYWPVVEIVRDAAGIRASDDPATVSHRLAELLERLPTRDEDELRTIAAAVANLIGAPTTPRGTYATEEISQAELHWGLRRVLQLQATIRPLVVVFEDLHWAEPTLIELLQSLVESDADAPILVLASARPELADSHPPLLAATASRRVLALEPLGDQESETLVSEVAGSQKIAGALVTRLLRNAAGNPLFLEETVRMLADAGGFDEISDTADVPVPDTLQSLIGSRLDALPIEQKRTAQHASIVGGIFWLGAVAHLSESDADLSSHLDGLARRDFVRPRSESSIAGDREYAFKHILVRDVAYERLPRGRRAELHVRFAEWLAALPAGEDEFVEIAAHHLEQSCHLARSVAHSPTAPPVLAAVDALKRSAQKAERREGFREADRFLERALALVDEEHGDVGLELRLQHCEILVGLGEHAQAHSQLLAVVDQARERGRRDIRCGALLRLANIEAKQGRATAVRGRLEEAEALAAELGDYRLRVRAWFELAYLLAWFEADAESAVEHIRRAVDLAERDRDHDLLVEGQMRLGVALFNSGRLADAERAMERCLELSGETGSLRDDARATSLLGLYRYYRGDLEDAERLALQALDWLDRTGDTYLQVQNVRELARYALARGDAELAERRLRDAVPPALETGGWLVIEIYRYLAEALVAQNRVEEAQELVAFAARNVPEEDQYARAALAVAEGIVAAAVGEEVGALKSFTEALTLLDGQNLPVDLGEARIAFARVLAAFGDTVAARGELERARSVFAPMEARAALAQIEQELAGLAVGAESLGPHT
jgi:class 3 adenylate cyclase/tetratricopeptide (TPR) repeat protein